MLKRSLKRGFVATITITMSLQTVLEMIRWFLSTADETQS